VRGGCTGSGGRAGTCASRRDRNAVAVVAAPGIGRGSAALAGSCLGRVLGRREEPLEVSEPIAAVAAGVDPVVTKPARVAPRPNRVRVHAEKAGGLRDGEGRFDGTDRERARQESLTGGYVKSTAAAYQSHTSCQ